MIATEKTIITVSTTVNAPVETAWALWTQPEHIVNWNNASADWCTPRAENDLREGGRFNYRMEARDGSMGFDFTGEYTRLVPNQEIAYRIADGRTVSIVFTPEDNKTHIKESFEAENTHPEEMQRTGWQAILDNFKHYAETGGKRETLHFEISIDAPIATVYTTMLDERSYREWTAEFCPTSYFKGSWEKGSKILFIGVSEDGKQGGMVSRIRENIPNEFVSIEHLGILDGEEEITVGPAVDGWAGAQENYSFRKEGNRTVVSVDLDSNEQFKSYFEQTWPKALQKLKTICEQAGHAG
ncbi:SRPBCC family protein [Flavisolibacter nicotianae]|uniref:SRPBCC family protein n=1 Tax=Flavisolibacter nicotianae TaxID=2364882 RepID=UPI000EAC0665|nr:SRPBCC family protein [Flavisolibacter nicotianae]